MTKTAENKTLFSGEKSEFEYKKINQTQKHHANPTASVSQHCIYVHMYRYLSQESRAMASLIWFGSCWAGEVEEEEEDVETGHQVQVAKEHTRLKNK